MGFTCANEECRKHNDKSKTGIQEFEGRQYVVCNYCGAENELIGGGAGPGATFQVLGILRRDKKK